MCTCQSRQCTILTMHTVHTNCTNARCSHLVTWYTITMYTIHCTTTSAHCSHFKLHVFSVLFSVEPCSIVHLYYNIYCSMLHLYYTIYCTVYCLWRKWDYTECVRGNVNSTDCTVHSVQCTLHTVAHQAANCTSVCITPLHSPHNVHCISQCTHCTGLRLCSW